MTAVWDAQRRYRIWFEIEAYAADALAELGVIPKAAAEKIWDKGRTAVFDVARIEEIERETKHDVIAFLTHLAEIVGPDARYVHQGLTSSDILDTCFAVQLRDAATILLDDLDSLLAALKEQAYRHRDSICIGRSHGIHAEPTTFGIKMAYAFAEFSRAKARLEAARDEVAVCAISGAVGTYANVSPSVEVHVAKEMDLRVEAVSTQVIPRDRHAFFFAVLGVVASSMERLATEIRHLQRTEVGEVYEPFTQGQKGSSAMPHKRNPVLTENVTGLARFIRSAVNPAMENVALWHERDISHSSVERILAPDATIALDFAIARLTYVIKEMKVDPERMVSNLRMLNGVVHSENVLLALTQAGAPRELAYSWVQRNAHKALDDRRPHEGPMQPSAFAVNLKADSDVLQFLSPQQIDELCSDVHSVEQVGHIFANVFGDGGARIAKVDTSSANNLRREQFVQISTSGISTPAPQYASKPMSKIT